MSDVPAFILPAFYGAVAYAASYVIHRVVSARRVTKDPRRWGIELEEDIVHLMQAHLNVAMIRASIAEKIDKVPKEFEDPLLVASELGFVVQRSVQVRCQQLGIPYPAAWRAGMSEPAAMPWRTGTSEPVTFETRGSVPPMSTSPVPPAPVPAPPRLPAILPEATSAPPPGPAFVWTSDGRMVPRTILDRP